MFGDKALGFEESDVWDLLDCECEVDWLAAHGRDADLAECEVAWDCFGDVFGVFLLDEHVPEDAAVDLVFLALPFSDDVRVEEASVHKHDVGEVAIDVELEHGFLEASLCAANEAGCSSDAEIGNAVHAVEPRRKRANAGNNAKSSQPHVENAVEAVDPRVHAHHFVVWLADIAIVSEEL